MSTKNQRNEGKHHEPKATAILLALKRIYVEMYVEMTKKSWNDMSHTIHLGQNFPDVDQGGQAIPVLNLEKEHI